MAAGAEIQNQTQLSALDCDQILSTVRRTIHNVTSTIIQDQDNDRQYEAQQRRLVSCLDNINRIRHFVDDESYELMTVSLQNLIEHVALGRHQALQPQDQHGQPREPTAERAVFTAERIRPPIGK